MSGFLWRRLSVDDEGISLVEVLVSIVILGIVLTAMLSTIVVALVSVQRNEARVRATALSQELLEVMTSTPWESLGLYVSEAPATDFEGADVVLIPDIAGRDPLVPLPVEDVDRDGRVYAVRRWVVWVDEGSDQDYKRVVAELSWNVGGDVHTMRSEAFRSPDPAEFTDLTVQFTELVNVSTGIPEVALNGPADADPYENAAQIRMVIEVSDPTATVEVIFLDRDGAQEVIAVPGLTSTRTYIVPMEQYRFANGPLSFIVTAVQPGPDGASASNTETLRFFQPLSVGAVALNHAGGQPPICVDAAGLPVSDLVVTVAIDGLTVADGVAGSVLVDDGSAAAIVMEPVVNTVDGADFTAILPGPFSGVDVTVTVNATRTTADPALSTTDAAATTAPVLLADPTGLPC